MAGHTLSILPISGVANAKIVLEPLNRIGLRRIPLIREFKSLMGFLSRIGLRLALKSIIILAQSIRHGRLSSQKLRVDTLNNGLST